MFRCTRVIDPSPEFGFICPVGGLERTSHHNQVGIEIRVALPKPIKSVYGHELAFPPGQATGNQEHE
jgi:hypothetical protein